MGVQNLADKFSPKVAERYQSKSYTQKGTSNEYESEFVGAQTVKIYSVDTAPLNDYDPNAAVGSRYGTPENLGNTVQVLTMTSAPSFTYVLDKKYAVDMPSAVTEANKTLKRQVDEKVTPFVDRYNLRKWAAEGGIKTKESAALTKSNVVEAVLTGGEVMDDNLVPREGRVIFVKPAHVKQLKLAPDFVGTGDMVHKVVGSGVVGEFDGAPLVAMPRNYWPIGVNFLIVHKPSTLAPMKLEDYKIHDKPQGVAGALVEGLFYHDLFVLASKRAGVYVSVENTDTTFVATPTATPAGGAYTAGTTTITLASATTGTAITYTIDGSDPKTSQNKRAYSGPISTAGWSKDVTVKAYASRTGMIDSGIVTEVFKG
jgi:hypothetical protein